MMSGDVDVRQEFSAWGIFWGLVFGVFALFATITNLLQGLFHFDLLPIFKNSLEGFRDFTHWVLDNVALKWLEAGITRMFPAVHFAVPDWYKDGVLISAVLSRARVRAEQLTGTDSDKYNKSFDELGGEEQKKMERNLFRFPYIIFTMVYFLAHSWTMSTRLLALPLSWMIKSISRTILGKVTGTLVATYIMTVVDGLLGWRGMFGLLSRSCHAVVVVPAGDASDTLVANARREVRTQWTVIVLALAASIAFFIWNGYALEYAN